MKKIKATRRMVVLLLMTLLTLSVSAQSVKDKTVTLDMTQVTVKQFFAEVKKQTGLNFIYSAELAKTFPRVTVKEQNKPVRQVLNDVMNRINCTYDLEGSIVTVTRKLSGARTRTVTGVVRDDMGETLPGVSICIDDSKVCTITDGNGFYTLKVPANACDLKFTFVGMENAIVHLKAGNGHVTEDVTMTSSASLDEVVVTGYQTISKKNMTGATATITAEALQDRYTSNIVSNLEGRIAGLSTYGGEIKIRGTSSLYAETSPLLVVDGLPMEGKLTDLNIYDIETVNVLKDAAATAIYGARASNGVIVVTTKNAKKKGKVDIDFSANLTLKENRNLDYNDNFYMNAEQQVKAESDYYDYYWSLPGNTAEAYLSNITQATQPTSALAYAYYRRAAGEISDAQLQSIKSQLSKNNFAKEFGDAVYRQQVMQEYNLSLRSRGEKMQNNLTLNFKHDNVGILNHMDRQLSVNYKGSFDLAKWLTFNVGINGVYGKQKYQGYDYNSYATIGGRSGGQNIWIHPAYEPFYNEDGTARRLFGWYDGNFYYDMFTKEGLVDTSSDPVEELYNNVTTYERQHMRYHGELLFKIIDGLTARGLFVYETDHTSTEWYANQESHAARTLRNAFTVLQDGVVTHLTPETGGIKRFTNTEGRYWTARGQLDYIKTFGKHAINAIAGLEFRETKSWGNNSILLGYDEQLQTSLTDNINFNTIKGMRNNSYFYNGYPCSQFAFEPYIENSMALITEITHRYGSGYANFTYTYDEKYNVFASWRKDYADVYGLNVKYRGKPLWSVGGAWNIDNESFMKDVDWVNYLKLRFSYGGTGNIYQSATSYMTASTGETNYYTYLPLANITSPGNPDLRWEKSNITNIGIDYSLFDNRLRGALDYYYKKSKDVFSNKPLDPTTGFTSLVVNAAEMRNHGIELLLTAEWFRARTEKDFGWSTTFTFTHNDNKVTKVENPSVNGYQLISNPFKEGYPASAVWSYRFAGISDGTEENGYGVPAGETLWYGQNGVISHNGSGGPEIMEYSGQTEPKTIIGIGNELQWQNFTLGVQMAYYGGHVMRCLAETETFTPSYSAVASYFLNAWTPENHTDTPGFGRYSSGALGSEPAYSNRAVHDASFLKIRNIVLGYNVPSSLLRALHVNRARLQFQIDNPKALWTANDLGVDPETLGIRTRSNYIFSLNVNL